MSPPQLQLQRNQLIDLTVTGLAFGGMGIAKLDQFVVFVTGAVPGDVVRARVTKNKKRYAEARVDEVLTPSPDRRPARCRSFGQCGGCLWQDLDYDVQLKYKTRQVGESLEHLGGIRDFELRPIVGMPDPWRYRNRADFSVGMSEEGAVVGFRPPGRWDTVLPLSECHLLNLPMEGVRATVQAWLREQGLAGWDSRAGTGYARHLLVRSALEGGEVLVSLVTVPGELPNAEGFVRRLREAHPEVVGIVHAVNGGQAEISSGLESTTLWGRPYLLEKLADVTLKVSVDAFFQTNTSMANELYRVAALEAGLGDAGGVDGRGGDDSAPRDAEDGGTAGQPPLIWDLYSGVGSLGLSLARRANRLLNNDASQSGHDRCAREKDAGSANSSAIRACRESATEDVLSRRPACPGGRGFVLQQPATAVLGIELVPTAVDDANENARLNGIGNATFMEGDVAKVLREVADGLRKLPEGLDRPDVIVIDPPRAGLSKKAVSRIGEVGAPRIVYVSCNPSTMAPNVAQLQEFGYRLERVTPVDMFPHTPHVECVGLLTLQRRQATE